jgi:hypothetical protein
LGQFVIVSMAKLYKGMLISSNKTIWRTNIEWRLILLPFWQILTFSQCQHLLHSLFLP